MSWQYFWLLCEKIACTVYEHEQVQNVGEFHVELLKKLLVYLAVKFVLYPNLLRIDVHSNQPSCPRIEMLWTAVLIPFAIVGMFSLFEYLPCEDFLGVFIHQLHYNEIGTKDNIYYISACANFRCFCCRQYLLGSQQVAIMLY